MGKVSAPTIIFKPAHSNNFTRGRVGGRNGQQTFHHVVGSAESAVAVFQNPSRQASATYIVSAIPGVIYQTVSEDDTSWCDGNLASNRRAITIEHHGDWRNGYRNETVLQNAAQLTAWLRDRAVTNHARRHREVSSVVTLCSADLPVEEIWNRATNIINSAYSQPAPQPPATAADLVWEKLPKTVEYVLDKSPTKLWNFNQTSWGGFGNGVKDFAKGDRVIIYGKVTNKTLNAVYLLTEYSFTQKITNGFNQADMSPYVAPQPPVTKPEWQTNMKDITPVKLMVLPGQTPIVNLNDLSVIKQLGQGTYVDFVATTTVKGVEYLISSYSKEHGQPNGIKRADVGVPETPPNSEKPDWLNNWYDIEDVAMYARADTDLVNLEDGSTIKVIPRGTKIEVASMTEWYGHKYAITKYSTDKNEGRGIRLDDLDLKPVDETPITPAPEQPEITPDTNAIIAFLQLLAKMIEEFLSKFKKG